MLDDELNSGSRESKHSMDVGEAFRLRQEGLSDRQIAHRLGVSRINVWRRLKDYQPPSESLSQAKLAEAPKSDTVQGSDTRAELEKFLAGVPKGDSLKSYLHPGNFAEFKRKIGRYNELAQRESFARALAVVHNLRRKAGWKVLTQAEVEASEEYQRLHFDSERQWVAMIVSRQIAETELSEADRASGNGNALYHFTWE